MLSKCKRWSIAAGSPARWLCADSHLQPYTPEDSILGWTLGNSKHAGLREWKTTQMPRLSLVEIRLCYVIDMHPSCYVAIMITTWCCKHIAEAPNHVFQSRRCLKRSPLVDTCINIKIHTITYILTHPIIYSSITTTWLKHSKMTSDTPISGPYMTMYLITSTPKKWESECITMKQHQVTDRSCCLIGTQDVSGYVKFSDANHSAVRSCCVKVLDHML